MNQTINGLVNKQLPKKEIQMTNKHEKCLPGHPQSANKNYMEIPSRPRQSGRQKTTSNSGVGVNQRGPVSSAGGMWTSQATVGISVECPQKTKNRPTLGPPYILLDVYLKDSSQHSTETSTHQCLLQHRSP